MSRPPGLVKGGYAFRPDDPEPCLGCKHRAKCETGYACDRFSHWADTGRVNRDLSPVPMRSVYARMFADDEPKQGSIAGVLAGPSFGSRPEIYGSASGRKSTPHAG